MLRWGASAAASTIQVENVAPEVSSTAEATADGVTLRFSAPTDGSAGLRYAVACDNGALAAATYTSSSPCPTASCPFPAAGGSHTIREWIIDKDGGFSEYCATKDTDTRTGLSAGGLVLRHGRSLADAAGGSAAEQHRIEGSWVLAGRLFTPAQSISPYRPVGRRRR